MSRFPFAAIALAVAVFVSGPGSVTAQESPPATAGVLQDAAERVNAPAGSADSAPAAQDGGASSAPTPQTGGSSSAPTTQVDGSSSAPTTGEPGADALIRLLNDPGVRDALTDYLRTQEAATSGGRGGGSGAARGTPAPAGEATADTAADGGDGEAAAETGEDPPAPHLAVRIAEATQALIEEGRDFLNKIKRAFTALPTALSYASGADWSDVQEAAIQLLLIAVAALGILYALRRLADHLFARLVARTRAATVLRRAGLLLARALVEALVVALAFGAGYLVAISSGPEGGRVELVESLFLNAFFFIQIAKVCTRFALSPKFSELRLVPLDDAQAHYWRRWLFAIYNLLGYGTMVVVPVVSNDISFVLANSLRMFIVLGSVGLAIVAVLRNRVATRDRILAYAEARGNAIASGMIELAARTWHLFAIFYVLLLFSVWLSRPFGATTFMLRATVLSVLAIMIGTLVSLALTRTITGGIRLPATVHARLPMLERRLNAFIPRVLSIVRLGVFFGVLIAILHAWGAVDVTGWSASRDGQEWIGRAMSAGIVILIGFLIWLAVISWIDFRLNPVSRMPTSREKTLFGLFRNAFSIILVIMVSLLALSEIGVNIGPLIAGAGVFGLAISFGSQKLVQDIITGAFIQVENAMNEGDVVTLGGVTGTVEKLTIRSVRLRDLDGTAHVIPFSTVDRVANFMRGFAYHVAQIGVAYDSDIGEVKMAMHVAFDRLKEGDLGPEILEPLEMHGVTTFGDSAITVRARIKTTPGMQWAVGRAYNEQVKRAFDERGIEIPFPQVTYHPGKEALAPPPTSPQISPQTSPQTSPQASPQTSPQGALQDASQGAPRIASEGAGAGGDPDQAPEIGAEEARERLPRRVRRSGRRWRGRRPRDSAPDVPDDGDDG